MNNLKLQHNESYSVRADNMMKSILSGQKKQHIMVNSAPDYFGNQDLYLNSYLDWIKHPKHRVVIEARGDNYEKY